MNKRDKKYYIIGLLAVTLVGIVFVEQITPSIWYQKVTKQLIELEDEYDGKDRLEQEKNAWLDAAKKCGFSKEAKVLLSGAIPDVAFYLNEDGQSIHPDQETHVLDVYDQGKRYSIQLNEKYRVFISNVEEELSDDAYYNFFDYIKGIELYDTEIVKQLNFPYYGVHYIPFENIDSVLREKEAKLYLFENGKYNEVEEIPSGKYGYFAYVGSEKENSYSREDGTYGYLFFKR